MIGIKTCIGVVIGKNKYRGCDGDKNKYRGGERDIFTTWFSLPRLLVVPLGFLIVSLALAPPLLSSSSPASATGVYIPYLGVTMNTSSLAGRFDFGIGMKSLRSPEELFGRKCEEGCSNNRLGFFFLHSTGFFVGGGLLVIGEVEGRVVVVDDGTFVDVVVVGGGVVLSVFVGTVVVLTVV